MPEIVSFFVRWRLVCCRRGTDRRKAADDEHADRGGSDGSQAGGMRQVAGLKGGSQAAGQP